MPQAQYGVSLTVGGVSIQKSAIRTVDHPNPYEITMPIAWPVTSWVKTSASVATAVLANGHSQTSGTYDVYWSGGARYGVPVTITTNAVALNGGTGTDFPASATTGVVICKQVAINAAINGDGIKIIAFSLEYTDSNTASTVIGHVDMLDDADASIVDVDMTANYPVVYDVEAGAANPFAGEVVQSAVASHSNTAAAGVLKILSAEDSTP